MTRGVAWMDGRSRAVGARQAQAASGTSKAGQTKGRADGQADGPNRAKIAPSAILARNFKGAWARQRVGEQRKERKPARRGMSLA